MRSASPCALERAISGRLADGVFAWQFSCTPAARRPNKLRCAGDSGSSAYSRRCCLPPASSARKSRGHREESLRTEQTANLRSTGLGDLAPERAEFGSWACHFRGASRFLRDDALEASEGRIEAIERQLAGIPPVVVRQHREVQRRRLVPREADVADLALRARAVQRLDDAARRKMPCGLIVEHD